MKIDYRQGIISAPVGFLKQSGNYKFVDLEVSADPLILAFADGDKDYLVNENASIQNAWGPFENMLTYYMFWDINTKTGQLSRGITVFPLIKSADQPKFARKEQMWWNTTEKRMYVYDGAAWRKAIRLLAGKIQGRKTITEELVSSQVDLNEQTIAGYILFEDGLPLKNQNGEFLTSDVSLSTGNMTSGADDDSIKLISNEDINQFDIVSVKGGYASKANGTFTADDAVPFGMVRTSATKGQPVSLFKPGDLVENKSWAFSKDQLGMPVFCSTAGQLTFTKPNKFKNVKVGTVISPESILLSFDSETDISNDIDELHSFSLQQLESAKAAVLSFAELANTLQQEIVRLESLLNNKAQMVHKHKFDDVLDLGDLINSKANAFHSHGVYDINGISELLAQKSDITHRHSINSLEDTDNIQLAEDGQVLTFNSAANKWNPAFITAPVVYKQGQFYRLAESDTNTVIDYFSQLEANIELPNNLPKGFQLTLIQSGDGRLKFSMENGALLRNKDNHTSSSSKWSVVKLIVRTNTTGISAEYVLTGDTGPDT